MSFGLFSYFGAMLTSSQWQVANTGWESTASLWRSSGHLIQTPLVCGFSLLCRGFIPILNVLHGGRIRKEGGATGPISPRPMSIFFKLWNPNLLCCICLCQNCWWGVPLGGCRYFWWKWDVYPDNDETRERIKQKGLVWFSDYCVDFWHLHGGSLLERITHIWREIKVKWSHSVMSGIRADKWL